jgi:hypothetical protein
MVPCPRSLDTLRHRSARHARQPQLPGPIVSRSARGGLGHAIVESDVKTRRSSFRTLRGAKPSVPGRPDHPAARQPQPARTDRMPGAPRWAPSLLLPQGGLKRPVEFLYITAWLEPATLTAALAHCQALPLSLENSSVFVGPLRHAPQKNIGSAARLRKLR